MFLHNYGLIFSIKVSIESSLVEGINRKEKSLIIIFTSESWQSKKKQNYHGHIPIFEFRFHHDQRLDFFHHGLNQKLCTWENTGLGYHQFSSSLRNPDISKIAGSIDRSRIASSSFFKPIALTSFLRIWICSLLHVESNAIRKLLSSSFPLEFWDSKGKNW